MDEDLDAAARRELREFRRTLLQQEGGTQSLRRRPESQARKKRRREERKAKAKASSSTGAASSLAAVTMASLPSGAEALLSLPTFPRCTESYLTLHTGILLLCLLAALLAVGAVARSAPGPTERKEPRTSTQCKGVGRALTLLTLWAWMPLAGGEERETASPDERRWDLPYFLFLVGLAFVGAVSLLTRLTHTDADVATH